MRVRTLSRSVVWLALLAASLTAAEVPRKSPEFAISLNNGGQILLSQHQGKVVVLAFILTTCPHCQHTTQILSKVQNEYGPRGLQVLASAIEEMAHMAVPDFIKNYKPSFPVGFNERNTVLEYLQHPAIFRLMMPQLVFVDRQGVIRAQHAGDDAFFSTDQEKNIRGMVETLLKENTAHKKNGTSKTRKKAFLKRYSAARSIDSSFFWSITGTPRERALSSLDPASSPATT
jgi:peroxiredoxin